MGGKVKRTGVQQLHGKGSVVQFVKGARLERADHEEPTTVYCQDGTGEKPEKEKTTW